MTAGELGFLTSIAAQLPLLLLFVWYNDRMLKRFDDAQAKRDEKYLAAIEKVATSLKEHDSRVDDRIEHVREIDTRKTRPLK